MTSIPLEPNMMDACEQSH